MKQRTKDFDQNKLKDMGKRHPVEKACGVLSTFPGSWVSRRFQTEVQHMIWGCYKISSKVEITVSATGLRVLWCIVLYR